MFLQSIDSQAFLKCSLSGVPQFLYLNKHYSPELFRDFSEVTCDLFNLTAPWYKHVMWH